MTKLEEVARAICTARERNGGPPWEYWLSEPGGKHVINAFMDDASAAVEAMRKPTGEMVSAGDGFGEVDHWLVESRWNQMIDAALGPVQRSCAPKHQDRG